MRHSFVSKIQPPAAPVAPVLWFLFRGYRLLVHVEGEQVTLPTVPDFGDLGETAVSGEAILRQHYLGYIEAAEPIHCYVAELPEESEAPDGMAFLGLRSLYGKLQEDHLWLAGRAVQIIDWDRTNQFCSRCGHTPEMLSYERAKKCPNCGLTTYPRLSPAVIVRVDRLTEAGPRLLLARNHRFPDGWFSVIAGFVEPGETLEACVRREIREEVGIEVKNIRYFGSQPWPFPHSLMIAYTADYAGGEFDLEEEEIAEAHWFAADELPRIPSRMSIARRLIDDFVDKHAA